MSEDTLAAMKKVGIRQANIMGISLGGMIAEEMAIKHPEDVESIIMCSAASRVKDKTIFETWKKYAGERDLDKLMLSFGESVYTPAVYEQFKDAILASGQGASELDYENFIISNDAIIDFDVYDELDRISCPVYVIGASEDKVLGAEASKEMAEKIGCDCYIYEGYGHAAYDEAPDYKERVKNFLDNNQ